jgi:hypothetical protein
MFCQQKYFYFGIKFLKSQITKLFITSNYSIFLSNFYFYVMLWVPKKNYEQLNLERKKKRNKTEERL